MTAENVLEVPVKGAEGEDKGVVTIEASRLDSRVRPRLLKEAVVMYAANKRLGTHSTKTRAEVRGSTRKPYRQKGTGRARAGTRKSPLWRGGGVTFGPKPRDYSYAIHRKQRRLALRSALLSKLQDGQVLVVEGLQVEAPKTSRVSQMLRALGVTGSCLIGTPRTDRNLVLSVRNIPGVSVSEVRDLNAFDVLKARTLVLTREAFDQLAEWSDGTRSEAGPATEEPAKEEAHEASGETPDAKATEDSES